MTELATTEPNGAVERRTEQPPTELSELMQWAQDARQASQVARSLATTSFVPASLRVEAKILPRMGDEEVAALQEAALVATCSNITGAILTGTELGLKPMASLRSIDIISGTPAMRAHAMRGLVMSHGHELVLAESTAERCVYRGRRKGSDLWQQSEWTIARAEKLGLPRRNAEWGKQPATMLIARATGEICRLVASDVLHGVPYAAEELYDLERPAAVQVSASRPVTAAEIMGGRPLTAEDTAGAAKGDRFYRQTDDAWQAEQERPAAEPTGRDRDVAQRHMFAILGDLAVKDRDDRLAVYSALKSAPIGSTDELDDADIESIVAALEPIKAMPDEERVAEVGGLVAEGQRIRSAQ
jgi:hypothetical protein